MPYKVLVTSTSFQDTPGKHHDLLYSSGYELDYMRGPLTELEMLEVIAKYDALLCGDDALTRSVLEKGKSNKLKIVSKYGVGLDKIDLQAASDLNIPVTNCPGVNQVSVAEHFFALLLGISRNVHIEHVYVQKEQTWKRITGNEIFGKKLLILGLGKIGKEIAVRAKAFGLKVYAYDTFADAPFCDSNGIMHTVDLDNILPAIDIISLNLPLTGETRHMLSEERFEKMSGVIIVNTARGELIDQSALIKALDKGSVKGYATDVLDVEPMPPGHPLASHPKVLITPHIGSRTFESVERQGMMAVENLINSFKNLKV